MSYEVPHAYIERYADLLINFALGGASGIDRGDWGRLGLNDSVVHTDIVSRTDREVVAVLIDGTSRPIYRAGRFELD